MNQIIKETEQYFRSSLQRGEQRKILYFYDKEKEYWDELEKSAADTQLFHLLEVHEHNYIYTNYLIEKTETKRNLFLYFVMEKPEDEENPLLDVLLYSKELKLDPFNQLSSELGIDSTSGEWSKLLQDYQTFFKAKERRNRFSRVFSKAWKKNVDDFEISIYAALAKVEQPDWMEVLIALFAEAGKEQQPLWKSIQKFGNEKRFWNLIYQLFGYERENQEHPLNRLLFSLFATHFLEEWQGESPKHMQEKVLPENNQAYIFINRWMNQKNHQGSFAQTADFVEEHLKTAELFQNSPLKELARVETFPWIDQQIIHTISNELAEAEPDFSFYQSLLAKRKGTFWYEKFQNEYQLLEWSILLLHGIAQLDWTEAATAEDLWKKYEQSLYQIDQAYRKFYFYYDQVNEQGESLQELQVTVERSYLSQFMDPLAERWEPLKGYEKTTGTIPQSKFYKQWVQPFIEQDKKTFVIISDGLRYEAGQELFSNVTASNRFAGELHAIQGLLPSYTALGMASLLPNEELEIQKNGEVLVDGMKSSSIEQRGLILEQKAGSKSMAIQYREVMQKNRDELRTAFAGKRLIYIYHNHIDAIGDQSKTENNVFQAVEDSFHQLQRLLTKLMTEVSAVQIFVTADHGFFYQRSPVSTVQKVALKDIGLTDVFKNKRFLLGKEELSQIEGLTRLLDIKSEFQKVAVPRGINRFTFAGGGYQYIHGGHLPQEIMTPVLDLKAIRGAKEDRQVDLTLLNQNRVITNSAIRLNFLQTLPVSADVKGKSLSIYFEDKSGRAISNEVILIAESENTLNEKRIYEKKFVLLNKEFLPFESCSLVMRNLENLKEVVKEEFQIDLLR